MKVFISHSSNDKKFVRTLKDDLNENGIETFVDEDSLRLGDSLKDKLDLALDESDHFLIILSDQSIKSDWVQYELKEALKRVDKKTMKKIIPIKYKECEIPNELMKLLFADLSNEVVKVKGKKVVMIGTRYNTFLKQLIAALRTPSAKLTAGDKAEMKKEVTHTVKLLEKEQEKNVRISHKIIRFKDAQTVMLFQQKVAKALHTGGAMTYSPVILPPIYRVLIPNLKIGDRLIFERQGFHFANGYFAGFRLSEGGMALDPKIRKSLRINSGAICRFYVNVKERRFLVL